MEVGRNGESGVNVMLIAEPEADSEEEIAPILFLGMAGVNARDRTRGSNTGTNKKKSVKWNLVQVV